MKKFKHKKEGSHSKRIIGIDSTTFILIVPIFLLPNDKSLVKDLLSSNNSQA